MVEGIFQTESHISQYNLDKMYPNHSILSQILHEKDFPMCPKPPLG